jgi:hypothetical protein
VKEDLDRGMDGFDQVEDVENEWRMAAVGFVERGYGYGVWGMGMV